MNGKTIESEFIDVYQGCAVVSDYIGKTVYAPHAWYKLDIKKEDK